MTWRPPWVPGDQMVWPMTNTAAFTCCLCDGSGLVPYPVSKTWVGGDDA